MSRQKAYLLIALLAVLSAAQPAVGWGPKTQEAVVTTALHVLNKEGVVQIARLAREVQQGASASAEVFQEVYPTFSADPLRAIEAEVRLLSAVRGPSVDPYFAYRLGLLGALVSRASAPLAGEPSIYRTQYYEDVDQNIEQAPLKPSQRRTVDAIPYLERIRMLANVRRDLLLKDYQAGIGWTGVARSSLAEEASRSVEAIANIWFTVLTGPSYQAAVSTEQIQNYVANAMAFYVRRGNEAEVDANYARMAKLVTKSPDFARRLGDIFYQGGMYERAIQEYEIVLRHEPSQRDILQKIAAYYVKVGDRLAEAKRLEQAQEAYARAAKVDPLHADAEVKRLEMETLINQRNARKETAKRLIRQAEELQTEAEQLALKGRHADAIAKLNEAEAKYQAVTTEFVEEFQMADAGLNTIAIRLSRLTNELIQNAQSLSGSGAALDIERLAENQTREIDQTALKALNNKQLNDELEQVKQQLSPVLEFR